MHAGFGREFNRTLSLKSKLLSFLLLKSHKMQIFPVLPLLLLFRRVAGDNSLFPSSTFFVASTAYSTTQGKV
jgi:hypothetical protein